MPQFLGVFPPILCPQNDLGKFWEGIHTCSWASDKIFLTVKTPTVDRFFLHGGGGQNANGQRSTVCICTFDFFDQEEFTPSGKVNKSPSILEGKSADYESIHVTTLF